MRTGTTNGSPLRCVQSGPVIRSHRVLLLCCATFVAATAWPQSPSGWSVDTLAGSVPTEQGFAHDAFLVSPSDVAVDIRGNILIANSGSAPWVRQVAPGGTISVFAGTTEPGYSGDGGPAVQARMEHPVSVATDARNSSVFLADAYRVRKVDSDGVISTVVGTGYRGWEVPLTGGQPAAEFHLGYVISVDFDPRTGRLYVVTDDDRIWLVERGQVFHFAGSGQPAELRRTRERAPTAMPLELVSDLAIGPNGSVYVTDSANDGRPDLPNNRIHQISPDGKTIMTMIPRPGLAFPPGTGVAALAVDSAGQLHFADSEGRIFRFLNGEQRIAQVTDLRAWTRDLVKVEGMVFGPDETLIVAESSATCNCVREWSPDFGLRTVAGGSNLRGDGGHAIQARFSSPSAVVFDGSGNLLVADDGNGALRSVSATNLVSTLDIGPFPQRFGISSDGVGGLLYGSHDQIRRLSTAVRFKSTPIAAGEQLWGIQVDAMAADPYGRIHFVHGQSRLKVMRLDPHATLTGVAGNGTTGDSGDGGPAVEASFGRIDDIAFDDMGHLYIVDAVACRVRRVDAVDGIITTMAGNGECRYSPEDGRDRESLWSPNRIALGPGARPELFLSSIESNVIQRVVLPAGSEYVAGIGEGPSIDTIAGTGERGFSGDGGDAKQARLWMPAGMAFGPDGRLYFADQGNHRIRVLRATDETSDHRPLNTWPAARGGVQPSVSSSETLEPLSGPDAVAPIPAGGRAGPDLVVLPPSIPSGVLKVGQHFTLSATVRNLGDGASSKTTVRYYRSLGTEAAAGGSLIGSDPMNGLSSTDANSVSISLVAPKTPGAYSYRACVGAVSGEADIRNNCSGAVTVAVRRADTLPCTVTLDRHSAAGGARRVSITESDLSDAVAGQSGGPVDISARMEGASNYDAYRIVLTESGRLRIKSESFLDMQVVVIDDSCTAVGTIIEDLGRLPEIASNNLDFAFLGDLSGGTYYFVVYEWAGRVGEYSLSLSFETETEANVNHPPQIESVGDQQVGAGDSATVVVHVADTDPHDFHAIWAESSDPSVATADLAGRGRSRRLSIAGQAQGTANVTVRAMDNSGEDNALSEEVQFAVFVTSPSLPAPTVEAGDDDSTLVVDFVGSFGARETRAYDFQIRRKLPQGTWSTKCDRYSNPSETAVSSEQRFHFTSLPAGLVFEVRYRIRSSASCLTGAPASWSRIGEGRTSGAATNQAPALIEGDSTARSVNENAPANINVGLPVSATDPDDDGIVLAYSLGGADASSFDIVSTTGQIRTGSGVTYDYESRRSYSVTVQVQDVHGASDSIAVTIYVTDLRPAFSPPLNLRTNDGNGQITVRWDAMPNPGPIEPIRGYEVEIRSGSTGPWGDLRRVDGRRTTSLLYTGLRNGLAYQVRVRTLNPEGPSDWSIPDTGTPTTNTAPKDGPDWHDRVRGKQLGPWRFPVLGRARQTQGDTSLDASYRYSNTGPNSGRITFEYDEIGRDSVDISILFSSLTSGSFVEDVEGAGENTSNDEPFAIEDPPSESGVLAPQDQDAFDKLALGKGNLIPGVTFGGLFADKNPLSGRFIRRHGEMVYWNDRFVERFVSFGSYTYSPTGSNSGTLTLKHTSEEHGEWVYDLTFIAPGVAEYTLSVSREGRISITGEGAIDFESDDHLQLDDGGVPILVLPELPPVLLPPSAPPQESGNDFPDIRAASAATVASVGRDTLQTILIENSGTLDVSYQPGDWLEPKDGSNQRMMIAGGSPAGATPGVAGATSSARKAASGRAPFGLNRANQGTRQVIALSVVCMQFRNRVPFRGSRFFSLPRAPEDAVELCQRDCVLNEASGLQGCVWECERRVSGGSGTAGTFSTERGIGDPKSAY